MDNPIDSITSVFKKLMGEEMKPDDQKTAGGPGDVGPSVQTMNSNLVSLDMSEEDCGVWWSRYEAGKNRIKQRQTDWDTLLKEYLPIVTGSNSPETVKVQAHFRNVHTKIGQLFYRSPDLVLTPQEPSPAQDQIPNPSAPPPQPGQPPMLLTMEDIIFIKQSVLKKTLGRDGIKAERLMDELLFDVLAYSGIGCSKLGYSCVMRSVPPPTQPPPSTLGLQSPAPQAQAEQTPIFEEKYWRRFSPKKVVFNVDLRSTRYDEDATFMGMDFYMSPKQAMAKFGLSEEEANKAAKDSMVYEYSEDKSADGLTPIGLVHGVELWVKAATFGLHDHPQAIFQLVLIEGIRNRPVVWRQSPDQEFDQTTGQLTPDSMIGFPIRILTIRDLTDSAFPPSDSAFTNSEIKQLSTWRRQSIQIRDATLGKYLYDSDAFDDTNLDLLKDGPIGGFIAVEPGKLADGADKILSPTTKIAASNDDYRGFQGIKADMNESLGISATEAGVETDTIHSATEVKAFSSGSKGRSDKELNRVVDFYLDGARMIDQLLMRYTTNDQYVQLEGTEAAAKLQLWNGKMISGRFYYDIAPDSQLRADTAQEFQLDLSLYNLTAHDALVNRAYVLRKLFRARGYDPNKAVIDPSKLSQPKPVAPTISFTFKGDDLAIPTVVEVLQRAELLAPSGGAPPPQTGAPMQPPHGGPVNKHESGKSGGLPNAPGAVNHREAVAHV